MLCNNAAVLLYGRDSIATTNNHVLSDAVTCDEFRKALPLKRLGIPKDVEGIAIFSASDESAYCTGGLCSCDGGLIAV